MAAITSLAACSSFTFSSAAVIASLNDNNETSPTLIILSSLIMTGSTGLSPGFEVSTTPKESTISWPITISPKTECLPSSQGVSFKVIKN